MSSIYGYSRITTLNILLPLLLLGLPLCFDSFSLAHAYFTTDKNLVQQCPGNRRYLVLSGAYASTSGIMGVCDDCGTATQTSEDRADDGSSVRYTYECDVPSQNYRCEELSTYNDFPISDAEINSGEWEICIWSTPYSEYFHSYAYKSCDAGYTQEIWNCGGLDDSYLDNYLMPSCRCTYVPPSASVVDAIARYYRYGDRV